MALFLIGLLLSFIGVIGIVTCAAYCLFSRGRGAVDNKRAGESYSHAYFLALTSKVAREIESLFPPSQTGGKVVKFIPRALFVERLTLTQLRSLYSEITFLPHTFPPLGPTEESFTEVTEVLFEVIGILRPPENIQISLHGIPIQVLLPRTVLRTIIFTGVDQAVKAMSNGGSVEIIVEKSRGKLTLQFCDTRPFDDFPSWFIELLEREEVIHKSDSCFYSLLTTPHDIKSFSREWSTLQKNLNDREGDLQVIVDYYEEKVKVSISLLLC